MKLIGISGKRGSGKDLLGRYLSAYGYVRRPFAGALKEAVRRDFGFTEEHTDGKLKEAKTKFYTAVYSNPTTLNPDIIKNYTPRDIMIAYGQFFRQFDPNWWVVRSLHSISDTDKIVVTDVRFENEANYIKNLGGFLVRLERKPQLNVYGPEALTDISETALDNYGKFDYTISAEYNVLPTDLEDAAARIIEKLA